MAICMTVANFKFVISDPKTGRSFQKELEKKRAPAMVALKIGDEFDGGILGLPGYRLTVTGGSDEAGFPMRPGASGPGRKRLLLSGGPGYRAKGRRERRRKTTRGAAVSEDLVQINTKVAKYGKQTIEEIFGVAPKEKEEKEEKETKSGEAPKTEASAQKNI